MQTYKALTDFKALTDSRKREMDTVEEEYQQV